MAFAPSKRRRFASNEAPELNLSSMMDMMTIILLFLLKSFSASGQLMQPAPGIQLPKSTAEADLQQTLALYIMPEKGIVLHSEGKEFEQMSVIASPSELDIEEEIIIPNFEGLLLERNANNESLNLPPLTELTIQADERIPYTWVLKTVQTASEVGITSFDFVIKKAGG